MLELQNISYLVDDDNKEILRDINLAFDEKFVAITGPNGSGKSTLAKIIAGILAILFGSLGIHKFVLGYTQEGIVQLVIGVVTCGIGGIIGFIEGIIYLTKSDEEFYQTYQVGKKGWF